MGVRRYDRVEWSPHDPERSFPEGCSNHGVTLPRNGAFHAWSASRGGIPDEAREQGADLTEAAGGEISTGLLGRPLAGCLRRQQEYPDEDQPDAADLGDGQPLLQHHAAEQHGHNIVGRGGHGRYLWVRTGGRDIEG